MKTTILLFVILSCSILGAAVLLGENFPYNYFPDGWTTTGPEISAWNISNTANAGGAAYEVKFSFTPSATGFYRFISPPFDTRKVHNMNLSFRHALYDYDTDDGEIIGVQISADMTNWTTLWLGSATENIAPNLKNIAIDYEMGRSETTYIAFFFEGNNANITSWFIDDVSLTYTNTLGDGIWPAGEYWPVGNVYVPDGYTWQPEAGCTIRMGQSSYIDVQGRLLANGTAEQNVTFTGVTTDLLWDGICFEYINTANDSTIISYATIEYTDCTPIYVWGTYKIRISNSKIRYSTYGAIDSNSNIIVENCEIYNNLGSSVGIINFQFCSPIFRNNTVSYNYEFTSILSLNECDLSSVKNNHFFGNDNPEPGGDVCSVLINLSGGIFERNIITDNYRDGIRIISSSQPITISNCTIANHTRYGIYANTSLSIINTIVYGNGITQILNNIASSLLHVDYSCIEDGISGIAGNGIDISNYNNNISADPQFLNLDYELMDTSPCIDAGDPSYPLNPDGTFEDIGARYRLLRPFIYLAKDISPDQGRQLDLRWNRNEFDLSYNPAACYYVFREAESRLDNAVYITSPQQLTPDLMSEFRDICWRDGTRTWHLIGEHPSFAWEDYALVVPTLQDSSSTGTHELDYMVLYADESSYWESLPKSGYSVDNIPPYAPSRLELTHTSGDQFNLSWDEVTEGGWEGNSYPEVNLITYKVYASDTPYFEAGPETYLMSTTAPEAVLTNQIADRKFYKIIASDSE